KGGAGGIGSAGNGGAGGSSTLIATTRNHTPRATAVAKSGYIYLPHTATGGKNGDSPGGTAAAGGKTNPITTQRDFATVPPPPPPGTVAPPTTQPMPAMVEQEGAEAIRAPVERRRHRRPPKVSTPSRRARLQRADWVVAPTVVRAWVARAELQARRHRQQAHR